MVKVKSLEKKVMDEMSTENEKVVLGILKTRMKEMTRLRKLMDIAEKEYKELINKEIDEVMEEVDDARY